MYTVYKKEKKSCKQEYVLQNKYSFSVYASKFQV